GHLCDECRLRRRWEDGGLILEAVARPDLDQAHAWGSAAHDNGSSRASGAPRSTVAPASQWISAIRAAAGEAMVSSIFIDSMIASGAPAATSCPTSAATCSTLPGIGAVTIPPGGSAPAAAAPDPESPAARRENR